MSQSSVADLLALMEAHEEIIALNKKVMALIEEKIHWLSVAERKRYWVHESMLVNEGAPMDLSTQPGYICVIKVE